MTQQYPYPYQPAYQPPQFPYQPPQATYPTLPNSSDVGKIASASKPIDAKYIAQTAFDIAEQMVAERKKRMKSGKGMPDTTSESDMKMSVDDEILPKPAQEAIVEM